MLLLLLLLLILLLLLLLLTCASLPPSWPSFLSSATMARLLRCASADMFFTIPFSLSVTVTLQQAVTAITVTLQPFPL